MSYFVCERTTVDKLRRIMDRLYAEQPLSGDQRRDLANALHAVLSELLEMEKEE